jgi:opacity protein-like surface antigen
MIARVIGIIACIIACGAMTAAPAAAQQKSTKREPPFTISAHLQFGRISQTARESFKAILGNSSGQVFGAGAEIAFRSGLFARFDASYFSANGERVDLVDNVIVPLGIPLLLSLTPIEFTGGYRLHAYRFGSRKQVALVPFVGAGAGTMRYHEETDEAHPDEGVDERHASYHVLVGLDVPLGKRVVIGTELTRRWVPGGLGSGGISQALGESDLGGSTFLTRVRFVIF